jgi:hypothetical protein
MDPVLQYDGSWLRSIPWDFSPAAQERFQEMMLSNGKYRYDIELDEDTHWALVKLGAELRMHQEDYAEQLLKSHCEAELNREASD